MKKITTECFLIVIKYVSYFSY